MIRSGSEIMNPDDANFTLRNGSGVRVYDVYVEFKAPFTVTPQVVVAIYELDTDHNYNTRIQCYPKDISPYGFTLRAETWDNTTVYQVGISWLAYTN